MKRRILTILFIILCLCITGCNKNESKYDIPIITASKTDLKVGETSNLKISNYDNFDDFNITTNPEGIVEIDNNGIVTSKSDGTVTIIITHKLDNKVRNQIVLTISKNLPELNASITNNEIKLGETTSISSLNYNNFNDFNITTNPEGIVEMNNDGVITAVSTGDVTITLTHKFDNSITQNLNLKVTEKELEIEIEKDLMVGGIYDFTIDGKTDFSNYNIVIDNNTGLKIENGYIFCYNKGSYKVTIFEKETNVIIKSINIEISEKEKNTTPLPQFNINRPYTEIGNKINIRFKPGYTVDDFDFITNLFDENGNEQVVLENNSRLFGLKPCKETLFARLKSDHSIVIELDYEFTTINPKIYVYRNKLFINETSYFTVSNFEQTYEKSLDDFIIQSSDENIISIIENKIEAVGIGKAQITLTSLNNERVTSSYQIEVMPNDENMLSMKVKENYQGTITNGEQLHLEIYNGTNILQDISKFTFVSSNDEILRVTSDGLISIINEGYGSVTAYETGNPSNKVMVCLSIHGEPNVDYIARLLHIAINEKGYVERQDPVTGEYVNDTKFNHWYNMDGAWCAMFVSWCWYHAGLSNELLVKYCSCSAGKAWCESAGIFKYKKEYTPKSGDIVFFLSAGASHTGIVIYSDETYVYTIEGNASNRVDVWRWSLKDARITGYAVPKYPTYTGVKEDFIWIKDIREDGSNWWNPVSEKHEIL